jgi:preprotein translocase subunit SecF
MEILKHATHIDFMSQRKFALILSAALIALSLGSLLTRGLSYGLDFTGGTLIEVGYPEIVDLSTVREALEAAGYGDSIVQTFGGARDILVRIPPRGEESSASLSNDVMAALTAASGQQLDQRRVEFVGPQIGDELAEQGGLAMVYALIGILFYIIIRFQWKFSAGAVLALMHDVVITIGFFSVFQIDFDLTVLAAVLAVIGYSLNDTIVVYDRVRENFRSVRKGDPIIVFNLSLNQTLARTLMTSMTTLLVLLALFFIGGEIIHSFATAMIIGVLIGTYSSIYVAGTALLTMGVTRQDLLVVQKEGAKLDHIP